MKSKQTNHNSFTYPHPILKNIYQRKQFNNENDLKQTNGQKYNINLPLYNQNYNFNINTMISPKLLRFSKSKIIPQDKFGMILQPFNINQQVQEITIYDQNNNNSDFIKKIGMTCIQCGSYFNWENQNISLYEIKCLICGLVQQTTLEVKQNLQDIPSVFEIQKYIKCQQQINNEECYSQINNLKRKIQKNICFVIQASEYNYTYKISDIIISCIQALKANIICNQEQNTEKMQINQQLSSTDDGSNQQNIEYDEIGQEKEYNQQEINQNQISYKIAFALFNDKNLFLINQQSGDLLNFNHQFLSQQQQRISSYQQLTQVILFSQFFKQINQIKSQTYEIMNQILYDSYLKNTSCLDFVTKFLKKFFCASNNKGKEFQRSRQVQFKFFVNSTNFTKKIEHYSDQSTSKSISIFENESQNKFGEIFKNVTNTITKKLQNHNKSQKQTNINKNNISSITLNSTPLQLNSNYEFFYLPFYPSSKHTSTSQKKIINLFQHNLQKIYKPQLNPSNKNSFYNQIYYDLYNNLTIKDKYHNCEVKIITSSRVELLGFGNGKLGYNDCEQIRRIECRRMGKKFNMYVFKMKQVIHSNKVLSVEFKIVQSNELRNKNSPLEEKHFIQVHIGFVRNYITKDKLQNQILSTQICQRVFHSYVTSFERPNIQKNPSSYLSTYVDDQILFYFTLKQVLEDCYRNKTSHSISKKLNQKIQQMAQFFKDSYGCINFPKQYKHIFLYAFMLMNRPLCNGQDLNFYSQRHQIIIKGSIENFAKYIYPRVYQMIRTLSKDQQTNQIYREVTLKNVKATSNQFKTNSMILLQNGINLFLVIGQDYNVQQIKDIFGTCFIHQILELVQIPQLQTNLSYRQAIDQVRKLHQSNYLPLKIIELFSQQFQKQIAEKIYRKQNHEKYMRALWDIEMSNKNKNKLKNKGSSKGVK